MPKQREVVAVAVRKPELSLPWHGDERKITKDTNIYVVTCVWCDLLFATNRIDQTCHNKECAGHVAAARRKNGGQLTKFDRMVTKRDPEKCRSALLKRRMAERDLTL